MANLKLIKELAFKQNRTLEELAASCGMKVQTLHLMVRTGSTKLDTLERVAKELKVPASIFFEPSGVDTINQVEVNGHHNPTAVQGGTAVVHAGIDPTLMESLLAVKDEMIENLKEQVKDLRADKANLQAEVERLKHKYEKK